MEFLKTVLTHWFFWGFMLGLFLCILSLLAHLKTKKELKRLKGHLSDKLEIEAEKMSSMKEEIDLLKKENENLRIKIQSGKIEDSSQALERELEIFARAEKSMVLNAPGFAQAWESAKTAANDEMDQEEAGKNPVKRVFRKFFKSDRDEEAKSVPVKLEVSTKGGDGVTVEEAAEKSSD
ncbi:MAG: hypothetical protein HKN23_07015 [Verrucomicrobiales bacterium]|nr:hypothetical protein [Verrucomicrobiales bacterium]